MSKVGVGILGCGTVGTGVAKILLNHQDVLKARNVSVELIRVADIDTTTDRGIAWPKGMLIDDAQKLINDPNIQVVVETIGGTGISKKLVLDAIRAKKHIVTANKALLATCGDEIMQAAIENNVDIRYEASVGGCMPIIKTVRESLVGNHIQQTVGILNGTCNYILSKITAEGSEFATVLKEAQELGYAEADPTLDIEGIDTAHKLAILASICYGTKLSVEDIYVEGIARISAMDIEFARQFGYRIKLLAISKFNGKAIELRVHPTMIPETNMLSNVNSSLNAVTIMADCVGDVLLYGYGAGMMPTASAIVSDVVDIARNLASGAISPRIPVLSYMPKEVKRISLVPMSEICCRYYFRFDATDQPGVLSQISGILGRHKISLSSVHQKGRSEKETVPIVMLTHHAKEANVREALLEIAQLDSIDAPPMLIRIENEEG